jgi:dienelactone hydrolase
MPVPGGIPMKRLVALVVVLVLSLCAAGCTGDAPQSGPGVQEYRVSEEGMLSLDFITPDYDEEMLESNGTVTLSKIILHSPGGDVYALLAEPADPAAAIIYAPGAGVKKDAHRERALRYAEEGIAFMVIDIRGNGGETPGYPFTAEGMEKDYQRFINGEWPQFFRIIQDLTAARAMVAERELVPVFMAGSSNGGRYAVIAAAIDQGFTGCYGISTAGFGSEGYEGDAALFVKSIDPETYIASISPRPVRIYHSFSDPIIDYKDGLALFNKAEEPKDFIAFNGTHGINSEVDVLIIDDVLKLNAP